MIVRITDANTEVVDISSPNYLPTVLKDWLHQSAAYVRCRAMAIGIRQVQVY